MLTPTAIQDHVEGFVARVDSSGRLQTMTTCTPRSVYRTTVTATSTPATLVGARAGRTAIVVQVLGAFAVVLRFAAENPSEGNDLLLAAGSTFTFPACNSYDGEIRVACTTPNSSAVLAIEFAD